MDAIKGWIDDCIAGDFIELKQRQDIAWFNLGRVVKLAGMGEKGSPTSWHYYGGRFLFVWTSSQGVAELSITSSNLRGPLTYWQVTRPSGTPVLGVGVDDNDPAFRYFLIIVREVAKERACSTTGLQDSSTTPSGSS